ncbi:glycosyltransferase [Virgibacillus halodenitrificans]|uniref:glycosyltransferase n=1 Tax=Virgibacillus halodenitrificans TaxID=1482 RepID=UPI00136DD18F|nr:glycosyltransferase [Virgibacillus halodenitrificans]MYL47157.1 glycosyltransferase [Virgibacillus halodenitrificans]
MSKVKITHIITGLGMGGAETMLYKLLKHINKEKYEMKVISMMDEGVYGEKIRNLGFEVISLNMKKGILNIKGFRMALKHIKDTDIIQTWMYHADLLGFLLSKLSKTKKLIWGIRRSNLDPKLNKKSTLVIAKINSILSNKVDSIVSCSIKAKEIHEKFGYFADNMLVIPNGFELNQFTKDSNAKIKVSNIIGENSNIPYITHVGRWNVIKDYENFVRSLGILRDQGVKFRAVLTGTNIDKSNEELMELLKKYNLNNSCSLLGRREDIATIMAGSDVFVSSSIDEGFPNVIGEAMACETPCVVTNAGDSSYIVGETGIVVPIKDSHALAEGISKILRATIDEKKRMRVSAHQRVVEKFDINKVVKQFEQLYQL